MRGFTFDDILLAPAFSNLDSRSEVSTRTILGNLTLEIPIISAPMDTVTEGPMANFMATQGGLGIIHRFNTIEQQVDEVKWVKAQNPNNLVGAAVGINGDSWERTQALVEAGVDAIVMDIAHGYTLNAMERASKIRSNFDVTLFSPNIATAKAGRDYESIVDVLRVGVGPGSACSTRLIAGVGVPQATAIQEVRKGAYKAKIVADGGIRNSGDIVKALAVGADAVMLGGMLAAYPVAAGEIAYREDNEDSDLGNVFTNYMTQDGEDALAVFAEGPKPIAFGKRVVRRKKFRGMASDSALSEWKGTENYIVEGEEFEIDVDYDFEKSFQSIINGLHAGMAYLGARSLREVAQRAEIVEVSPASLIENTPHYRR